MLDLPTAQAVLHDAGVRLTPQRMMVVEALAGNRTHPTVEHIYEIVRQKYPTVSLATVYHTVTLLARHGLILELRATRDGLRCDPDTTRHAHAYCQQCGAVFDVPLLSDIDLDMGSLGDFQPDGVEVALYGACARCRQHDTA